MAARRVSGGTDMKLLRYGPSGQERPGVIAAHSTNRADPGTKPPWFSALGRGWQRFEPPCETAPARLDLTAAAPENATGSRRWRPDESLGART